MKLYCITMRTASRIWLLMMCMVAAVAALGQAPVVPDTVPYNAGTGEIKRTPFERYWTKSRIVPKLGVGAMDRAFVELGIQLHSIYRHPLTLLSHGPYTTVDVFIGVLDTQLLIRQVCSGLVPGPIFSIEIQLIVNCI